jgi:hypothetical protein
MVINKPERIMKGLRISLIPAGYMLNIIGKIINKQHIELLGHYLTCSGKDYTLDPKILAKVIENDCYGNEDAYFEFIPICEIKHAFIAIPKRSSDINNILGKFILFINENGEASIIDEYKFYPCQDCASFEISTSNKMWADIDLVSKTIFFKKLLPIKLWDKWIRFNIAELENKSGPFDLNDIEFNFSHCCNELFELILSFSTKSIWINISFRDKFFYFLGKRFNVKTNKFKLSERRFNYLIKEWNKLFEHHSYYWNHNEEEY